MNDIARNLCDLYLRMQVEREASLGGLEQVFTPDVHFRDPFRETHGMAEFKQIFVRWLRQYRRIEFRDFEFQGNDELFVLTYDMALGFAVGPLFVVRITSLHRTRNGLVYDLADSFDFSSALASPVPLLGRMYRKTVNALFL